MPEYHLHLQTPPMHTPNDGVASSEVLQTSLEAIKQQIVMEYHKLNAYYQERLNKLQAQGVPLYTTAKQTMNMKKNRYSNILAMEFSRVRLQGYRDLFLESDYINANYINGELPGSEKAYISCQAPLPSTVSHFWLMIWEQKSSVIVMLTRLQERGRCKACEYWPNFGETKKWGDINVTFTKTKKICKYLTMRTLVLEKTNEKPRQIIQLQYTEWPDFGIPSSSNVIRTLVRSMDNAKAKGLAAGLNGPVVAHCSAGVGRTGTFLAIHISLQKMKFYRTLESVNVPQTVLLLRQTRAGMVQTAEQYLFIYEAVKDAQMRHQYGTYSPFPSPPTPCNTTPCNPPGFDSAAITQRLADSRLLAKSLPVESMCISSGPLSPFTPAGPFKRKRNSLHATRKRKLHTSHPVAVE